MPVEGASIDHRGLIWVKRQTRKGMDTRGMRKGESAASYAERVADVILKEACDGVGLTARTVSSAHPRE